MKLLAVHALQVSLGGKPILHGIDLDILPGEFVGLIGPNGAGKSTLLRAVFGLVPAKGRIAFMDEASNPNARDRARYASFLPQEREIAWPLAVRDLVALGREPHRSPFAPPSAADEAAVKEAMDQLEIGELADRRVTDLSGGERARVLIARALAQQAPLLLADEPIAGLDPAGQINLMHLFRRLARKGFGVLASMHDLGLAARWCDRLILIADGRIAADGKPDDVLTREHLRDIYGVTAYRTVEAGSLILMPLDLTRAD